jgi:Ran GTPase-activating protein (RanGAP) involved in mRNA processing and transport
MKKQRVNIATIDVERDDLFGEINYVISFLTKIKDKYSNGEYIEVFEDWNGYEDNYFEIRVTREETDEECLNRENAEKLAEKKEIERQNVIIKERLRKENINKQIDELKKQLK